MEVLWGEMSAAALQRLNEIFLHDLRTAKCGNLSLKAVEKFKSLGNDGRCWSNVWRDLERSLPSSRIPLTLVLCPFHHKQLGDFERTLLHIRTLPFMGSSFKQGTTNSRSP